MKKICLLLMAAIATNLFAQTLTFEQVANCTDPKNELLKEYQAYTASDGHTYVQQNMRIPHVGTRYVCRRPYRCSSCLVWLQDED